MKQRTITAIVMAIILVPLFILGGWFTNILFAILAYIGTYELINIRSKKSNLPKICKFIIPLFSTMIVIVSCLYGLEDVIYVLLVQFMFLLLLPIFNKRYTFNDVLMFIFGIIYSGVMFSIVARLRNIEFPSYSYINEEALIRINTTGLILVTYVLITTMFTDIFAYLFGIKFGKHKLCPTISPKKSVEGAIAGTVFGAVFGTLFIFLQKDIFAFTTYNDIFYTNKPFIFILIFFAISFVLSIAGQLGDLIASKIKREYDVKDYGNIFPGHGGVLDRFDSSIYSSLVFFIILMMLGVI